MNAEKITIDSQDYQRFALSDHWKTIMVGEKKVCATAVVGDMNAISSCSENGRTAVSGCYLDVDINAKGAVTAIAGILYDINIGGANTITSVSGDSGGHIRITGTNSRAAICTYEATVDVSGDNQRLAICDASFINITGNNNEIAVVGCAPLIDCIGTGNRISCSSPGTIVHATNGNWLSFASCDDEGNFVGYATGCIGENGLNGNVGYFVKNGQFVEAYRAAE